MFVISITAAMLASTDKSNEAKIPLRTPKSNSVDWSGQQYGTPRTDHSGNSSNASTREVRNVLSAELNERVFEGVPIDNFPKDLSKLLW